MSCNLLSSNRYRTPTYHVVHKGSIKKTEGKSMNCFWKTIIPCEQMMQPYLQDMRTGIHDKDIPELMYINRGRQIQRVKYSGLETLFIQQVKIKYA